ncbi:MAG: metallophosphoesterase [Myxococcales bacterium]|nr:metallophosphoesterase [Myxococcales bacterium]
MRRRSSRWIALLFGRSKRRRLASAGFLGASMLLGVDAVFVEPYRIEVPHHAAAAAVASPIVLAHLSDLHTHGLDRREQRVVEILDRESPDVIVVTGDLVDDGDLEAARPLFAKIHAPLGVWVVRGNWENWRPPPNERATIESFGAKLLVNEGTLLRPDVWLAGLDDPMSGTADIDTALRGAPPKAAKIALFHSPDVFDAIAPRIDLAFAGHTHGGQVRLPLIGALWTPPGSGRYVDGWYDAANARMLVSRGVGTSVIGVRFLCPPEVAIVTITPTRSDR